ncbi:MAG: RpiB/LacA/LacB family sugar-phosphate isomerase [Planctomycetota bacterium]|jgi:ribose 5-phosphate isomerase B
MRLALGSDHRGDAVGRTLAEHLRSSGHELVVLAPCDAESCDYPDPAYAVARAVSDGLAERGILLCGSGNGVAIAANKVDGVRAAVAGDRETAEASRRHNDANVLCLGTDRLGVEEVIAITTIWLETGFDGGRHARRVAKIEAIERGEDPRQIKGDGSLFHAR